MPHFTLPFIEEAGPLLNAVVTLSAPRLEAMQKAGLPIPAAVTIRALVDTGASCTCVDPGVFLALGLSPVGSVSVITPSTGNTPHQASQYDIGLMIPPSRTDHQPLIFPTLAVTESALTHQGIQALIGRDILRDCILEYNGSTGTFTLAF